MGQINSTKLPEYLPEARASVTKPRVADPSVDTPAAPETIRAQDNLQFTKLSNALNSLKKGASAVGNQVSQVMSAVRNGTYKVDPLQVSRSIVGESLAAH